MICERGESEHEYRKYESIKSPCSCGGIISLYSDADAEAESAKQPDADPFDLLCHIAYNAPLRTRRERAEMLKREKTDFFEEYSPQARKGLAEILEKYIEYGTAQFQIPEILKFPPISHRGTVVEIAALFGGAPKLRTAVHGVSEPHALSCSNHQHPEIHSGRSGCRCDARPAHRFALVETRTFLLSELIELLVFENLVDPIVEDMSACSRQFLEEYRDRRGYLWRWVRNGRGSSRYGFQPHNVRTALVQLPALSGAKNATSTTGC